MLYRTFCFFKSILSEKIISFSSKLVDVNFFANSTISFSDFPFSPNVALVNIKLGLMFANEVSLLISIDNSIPNAPLYVCASSNTTNFQFFKRSF